jgi:predicted lipoprotein with Yx(FWY)xxD motif
VIAVGAAGTALAGTGAAAGPQTAASHGAKTATVLVKTRTVKGLGAVLVDHRGRTLYMFVPDKRRKVTCTGSCAVVWPPLKLPTGAKLAAGGKAKRKLLGSDRNPAGGRVVTYHGWPLYTYVGDTKPGAATGQALNLNGGYWYVLAPSGKVVKKKP